MGLFSKKNTQTNFIFNLGDEVRDKVTGFTGVIMCRCQWLYACNVYGVKSRQLKEDGTPRDMVHLDEPALELVEEKKVEGKRDTGGPERKVVPTNR